MRCDRCGREAMLLQRYSGLRLCGDHLVAALESRAKRRIRARGWVQPGDRIAVGLSGGPCSSSLLHFLSANFGMRRDLSLVAVTVDEGRGAGGGVDMARVRRVADGMGIEWAGGTIPGDAGYPQGTIHPEEAGEHPGSLHTRLRDRALSSLAFRVGATRLALGTSLDDEAGSVFLHVIRGEPARLHGDHEGGGVAIPLIRPFSRIPEEELQLYARLNGIDFIHREPRTGRDPLEHEAGRMLLDYTRRHPSALFSLANLAEALPGEGRSGRGGTLPAAGGDGEPARGGPGRVTDHGR